MTTPPDWDAVRADYESGKLSLRQLAATYGISKTYLIEKRNKEHWNRPDRPTTDRPPDTQGGTNRDVNAALRVAKALELRAQKLTYEEIAKRCGYANAKSAHRAIQRELERVIVENVEELRREECYILDQGHGICWELFTDKKNRGRLFAYDRVLATSEARRKLMGIDKKPDESGLTGQIIVQEIPMGLLGESKA